MYTCQPQSSSTFSLAIVASLCRSGSRSEATISTDRERRCTTYQMHLWVPTCRHPRVLPHRNIDALTLPPAHSLGDFSQIHHIFMIVFWILTVRKMVLAHNPCFGEIWGRMNKIKSVQVAFTGERHYVFKILFRLWMIYLSFSITTPIGLCHCTTVNSVIQFTTHNHGEWAQLKMKPLEWTILSQFSSVVQSCPNSLRPHGLHHARLPCPSPTPRACSNSWPLSRWCHPTTSSSIVPFSSCLQPFPASGSFPMSQFYKISMRNNTKLTQPEGFPDGSVVKNAPAKQETWVWSLGWEDPLDLEMAPQSSILAWEIP